MAPPRDNRHEKERTLLQAHVERLLACSICPQMQKPVVSGGAVISKVMLVGQAPGDKEPLLQRPFAWTAGKTLFRWFDETCGITEEEFRASIYMAAVCRCFPGKNLGGGDRVPSQAEVENCSTWLEAELEILRPELIIPVGRLAISQFVAFDKLEDVIGQQFRVFSKHSGFDLIPLPHPSGASTWHRREPGKSLLKSALQLVEHHPSFINHRA